MIMTSKMKRIGLTFTTLSVLNVAAPVVHAAPQHAYEIRREESSRHYQKTKQWKEIKLDSAERAVIAKYDQEREDDSIANKGMEEATKVNRLNVIGNFAAAVFSVVAFLGAFETMLRMGDKKKDKKKNGV